jgi:uncharacterized protein (DUF58 family)
MRFFRRRSAPDRVEDRRRRLARRVRDLELVTARLVRAGFAGQYNAAFHGHGIEFAQVREYQPGDDIRTIDWNVTARSGVPHVKQFVEERDLTLVVALDVSGSMGFGSLDRRKVDLGIELAAVLSFAALQNRDRVGLLLFGGNAMRYVPPRRGRTHVETAVRDALVAAESTGGAADLNAVARFLDRVLVKPGVVVVISDFLECEIEHPMRRLAMRHDTVAFAIRDPREERLPAGGLARFRDSESGKVINVRLRGERLALPPLSQRMNRTGADLFEVSTVLPYERELVRFFEQRALRRGR